MKLGKINVIGYYNHNNLGDEQYKHTLTHLLKQINPEINMENVNYIDCDKIVVNKLNPEDLYIIGGGDVLVDYFLDKLQFFNNDRFRNTRVITLSSGLPYKNYSLLSKMLFIDYFFMRSKSDVEYLKQFFPERVFYLPDLCFLTKRVNFLEIENPVKMTLNNYKNILVCPTQFSNKPNVNYALKEFMSNLLFNLNKNFNIYILPFGEKDENISIDLFREIYTLRELEPKTKFGIVSYINFGNDKLTSVISAFKNTKFDYCIPMRYHSVLYSTVYRIPFYPIYSTSKIKKFLSDIDWKFNYYTENSDLNVEECLKEFKFFTKLNLHNKIYTENIKLENALLLGVENVIECLKSYTKNDTKLITAKTIQDEVLEMMQTTELNNDAKEFFVKLVSYRITGNTNSVYNWGLYEKMFKTDFDWISEISWVLNDFYLNKKPLVSKPDGIFNLNYFNQEDYSGSHRAGWNYVYSNLIDYHNRESDVILDLYLDRTFGWDYNINTYLGLIPYNKTWCGFIHHTFNTEFSEYNIYEYFEKPNFLKSLQHCKCLFVLSKYLKRQLEYYLGLFDFKIPVYALVHPTDFETKRFDILNFDIEDYKLIHIGGWLRNIYSFYKLSGIPNKYILQGKNMTNYLPPKDLTIECNKNDSVDVYKNCCPDKNCCTDKHCKNQWVKDLKHDLVNTINSVRVIENISNEEYDELLSRNVVFINLHDGSAVNTIIECIVRATPIVVNKTEFTTELLGEGYPLYYNNYANDFCKTNDEIKRLLNRCSIYRAHLYLKMLPKKKYTIEYFLKTILKYF